MREMIVGPDEHRRERDGFRLTDRRMKFSQVLNEVDYCLYCHDRDKDSCSKGLRDSKSGAIKPNALGIELNGCPLDEKISEMHLTKRRGDSIGALALVCIDNPMCPGTGHRICNDCMKACVYQKQKPVDIPQIETAVLTDVLGLPWGLEIYGLLTRWNPLNVHRPYALPYRGQDVLVVGLGPAGYTLAHHLLNEGFGVVGIDGLKLEPLPASVTGDWAARHAARSGAQLPLRGARRSHPGRLRRRLGVRHHRALGQELPRPPVHDAVAARQVPRLRRRAPRRHHRRSRTRGSSASRTSPSRPARASRPSSTWRTTSSAACARRPTS